MWVFFANYLALIFNTCMKPILNTCMAPIFNTGKKVVIYVCWQAFSVYWTAETFLKRNWSMCEPKSVSFWRDGHAVLKGDATYDLVVQYIPRPIEQQGKFIADIVLSESLLFTVVPLTLLAIQVMVNDNAQDVIRVDFGGTNFFVCGNVLFSRPFLQWYLWSKHSRRLQATDTYSVSFINEKMKLVNLKQECILVLQDSYVILDDNKKNI